MLTFPLKYPRRVRRSKFAAGRVAPSPLTLVSAIYSPDDFAIDLTFDRAIDVSGLNVLAFFVDDHLYNEEILQGDADPIVLSPVSVRVPLTGIDDPHESGVHLKADADNGIVAASDGSAWSGVLNLELPYP